jgi:putative ABC transport system substrate-binding protein
MPVIGFLSTRSPDESAHVLAAFRQGLAESGYAEGRNVTVEYRWAQGRYDRLPGLAAELAGRPVAVLAATGGEAAALAAKDATATIPVVATFSTDPVELGTVASLGRPGGNVTGFSNLSSMLEPKRFGLLHEVVPQAATFGVLLNPNWPTAARQLRDTEEAARAVGVGTHVLRVSTDREIDVAFESVVRHRIPALAVLSDAFLNTRRDKLAGLAARHAVPAMYSFRDYALAGGLMSYGIDLPDVYRRIGIYAGRILRGAKPADLPIMQPTKFEFVINLRTAKALGLAFPAGVLAIADEVIE